jgi:site-specific DNA-methyltransferase (cytosine-N4-specific)
MTDSILLSWHEYRYFPYEREFARREVEALLGTAPRETEEGLLVLRTSGNEETFQRLTYVRPAMNGTGQCAVPMQALLESSAASGQRPRTNADGQPSVRRQQTRYSAHGLHEYRGKFNPQVVRAVGNMFRLEPDAWVLDPFCGSGTTLLECAHNGWNAVGVDANPLGAFIANAKIEALRGIDGGLLEVAMEVLGRVSDRASGISHDRPVSEAVLAKVAGSNWLLSVPNSEYLIQWFPKPVLAQAAVVLQEIQRIRNRGYRSVLLTLLSDVLRDVSYQDPADLRIRRRVDPSPNYPLVIQFDKVTRERLERVGRARAELRLGKTMQRAYCGDSRKWLDGGPSRRAGMPARRFDAVITSPPYANALPYIDTQRLSLCLLGLVSAADLRTTEAGLIGNREIGRSERDAGAEEIERNAAGLPESVVGICREMLEASLAPENGFRKQNTPSLVYRYFRDMAEVFSGLRARLREGGPLALLVGRNHTNLGGKEFAIDTPSLLCDVACQRKLRFNEMVELDAYHRFGMHQKNSIRKESMLLLQR